MPRYEVTLTEHVITLCRVEAVSEEAALNGDWDDVLDSEQVDQAAPTEIHTAELVE